MTGEPLRIIALDGADHRVVTSLLDAGRMPALDAVRQRGATVRAHTVGGWFEESVWPSVFTGESLGDHGTQHFVRFDASDHGLIHEREVEELEPFWLHLPAAGAGTLAVDIPQVHPHPRSNAEHACGWAAWSSPHRTVFRPRSLRRRLGRTDADSWLHEFDHEPTLDDERAFSRRAAASAVRRALVVQRAGRDRRVVCTGVAELHGVAHLLGHHWLDGHPHRPWPPEPQLVTDVYEATDRALAALLDDERANAVVIASQGFRPSNSCAELLPELLERAGLSARPAGYEVPGDSARHLDPLSLLRRWLPADLRERLAMRLLPVAIQIRLMSQEFRTDLDWSRTRVFALPSWTTGYLRVNLAGREAFGIVPASEYDALLDEVERLLLEVEIAPGQPLVAKVHRMRRDFPGRRSALLPDLAIEWAPATPASRASHPVLGTWDADTPIHRYRWSEHHGEAVAFLAGPAIRSSASPVEVEITGAAATFLRLAGVRPPSNLAPPWQEVLA